MTVSYNRSPIYQKIKAETDGLIDEMKGYVFQKPYRFPYLDKDDIQDLEVLYFFDRIEREEHSTSMQRIEDDYLLEYQRLGDVQAYLDMWNERVNTAMDLAELERIAREEGIRFESR